MHKLDLFLDDSLNVDGAIIDFRIYDSHVFSKLITRSSSSHKKIYGLDTMAGLDHPSEYDLLNPNINEVKYGQYKVNNFFKPDNPRVVILKTDNYNDLHEIINPDEEFCFANIDLKQYIPTKKALNYIWDKIAYGGTIYFNEYRPSENHSAHKAIKEFITLQSNYINSTRQMMTDNGIQTFLAVKCFNPSKKPLIPIFNAMDKVSIAMVLKTGGDVYNYNYVNALAKNIKKHLTINHEIVCLTNDPTGFSSDIDRVVPLTNDYPTWWSKIELFREHQFNTKKVFYLDLDTIIVKNIDEIVSSTTRFSGLRDFYGLCSLGSGLMAWNTDYTQQIYTKFAPVSRTIIANYKEGDQKWIDEQKPSINYFQDMYPNEIVSYKRHCVDPNNPNNIIIPPAAKIICFHGNPRPHTVKHPSIIPHWQP